jgi:hypothetical protein
MKPKTQSLKKLPLFWFWHYSWFSTLMKTFLVLAIYVAYIGILVLVPHFASKLLSFWANGFHEKAVASAVSFWGLACSVFGVFVSVELIALFKNEKTFGYGFLKQYVYRYIGFFNFRMTFLIWTLAHFGFSIYFLVDGSQLAIFTTSFSLLIDSMLCLAIMIVDLLVPQQSLWINYLKMNFYLPFTINPFERFETFIYTAQKIIDKKRLPIACGFKAQPLVSLYFQMRQIKRNLSVYPDENILVFFVLNWYKYMKTAVDITTCCSFFEISLSDYFPELLKAGLQDSAEDLYSAMNKLFISLKKSKVCKRAESIYELSLTEPFQKFKAGSEQTTEAIQLLIESQTTFEALVFLELQLVKIRHLLDRKPLKKYRLSTNPDARALMLKAVKCSQGVDALSKKSIKSWSNVSDFSLASIILVVEKQEKIAINRLDKI